MQILNTFYKEILKLDRMLSEANIPHSLSRIFDGWQICYPTDRSTSECVMDAIEHFGSFGSGQDKLEIMGLLTPEEEVYDDVLGYLTAEDVFERIRKYHNGKWDDYIRSFSVETSEKSNLRASVEPHDYARKSG